VSQRGEGPRRPRKKKSGRRPSDKVGKAQAPTRRLRRQPQQTDQQPGGEVRRGRGSGMSTTEPGVKHRTALPASRRLASVSNARECGSRVAERPTVAMKSRNGDGARGPQFRRLGRWRQSFGDVPIGDEPRTKAKTDARLEEHNGRAKADQRRPWQRPERRRRTSGCRCPRCALRQ